MLNSTRGRSYTNFPRNTKVRHVQTCADAVREQERIKQEMEACYGEWAPVQIHSCADMLEADLTAWDVENVEKGLYAPRTEGVLNNVQEFV